MDRNELERELTELCERVSAARYNYERLSNIEVTVRSVHGYSAAAAAPYRAAKELLADLVREQALDADKQWRNLIIACADRIEAANARS